MAILIGDDAPAVKIEDLGWLRDLARRLGELEEERTPDAEDILTQVEESIGLDPIGDREWPR